MSAQELVWSAKKGKMAWKEPYHIWILIKLKQGQTKFMLKLGWKDDGIIDIYEKFTGTISAMKRAACKCITHDKYGQDEPEAEDCSNHTKLQGKRWPILMA